jgi:hypothetical protein
MSLSSGKSRVRYNVAAFAGKLSAEADKALSTTRMRDSQASEFSRADFRMRMRQRK